MSACQAMPSHEWMYEWTKCPIIDGQNALPCSSEWPCGGECVCVVDQGMVGNAVCKERKWKWKPWLLCWQVHIWGGLVSPGAGKAQFDVTLWLTVVLSPFSPPGVSPRGFGPPVVNWMSANGLSPFSLLAPPPFPAQPSLCDACVAQGCLLRSRAHQAVKLNLKRVGIEDLYFPDAC